MKRNNDKDERSIDSEIDTALSSAKPRQAPRLDRKEEIYGELRSAWLDDISVTKRRRRFIVSGLAASIVAAVVLSLQLNSGPQNAISQPDAVLARSVGSGTTLNGFQIQEQIPINAPLQFRAGDELTTGENAAIAIDWNSACSLRVSSESTVVFESGDRVALVAGSMYFDSKQYGAGSSSSIIVDTPLGRVHHVGTQFVATVSGSSVTIAVREGKVSFGDDSDSIIVKSGQSVLIEGSNGIEFQDVAATDDRWAWASHIAPPLDVDGRSTRDIIEWLSRESGRSVEYRSSAAESYAASDTIRGIGQIGPSQAMNIVPLATRLRLDIDKDTIRVGLKNR